jgi:hypothetical protein
MNLKPMIHDSVALKTGIPNDWAWGSSLRFRNANR